MIILKELTDVDIGRSVIYTAGLKFQGGKAEHGVITSWNDHYVFVRYEISGTSQATRADNLEWPSERDQNERQLLNAVHDARRVWEKAFDAYEASSEGLSRPTHTLFRAAREAYEGLFQAKRALLQALDER